jgi:hypothetical protein
MERKGQSGDYRGVGGKVWCGRGRRGKWSDEGRWKRGVEGDR